MAAIEKRAMKMVDLQPKKPYSKGADKKANAAGACNTHGALSIGLVGQPEPDAILLGFSRRVQPITVDAPFCV